MQERECSITGDIIRERWLTRTTDGYYVRKDLYDKASNRYRIGLLSQAQVLVAKSLDDLFEHYLIKFVLLVRKLAHVRKIHYYKVIDSLMDEIDDAAIKVFKKTGECLSKDQHGTMINKLLDIHRATYKLKIPELWKDSKSDKVRTTLLNRYKKRFYIKD